MVLASPGELSGWLRRLYLERRLEGGQRQEERESVGWFLQTLLLKQKTDLRDCWATALSDL